MIHAKEAALLSAERLEKIHIQEMKDIPDKVTDAIANQIAKGNRKAFIAFTDLTSQTRLALHRMLSDNGYGLEEVKGAGTEWTLTIRW